MTESQEIALDKGFSLCYPCFVLFDGKLSWGTQTDGLEECLLNVWGEVVPALKGTLGLRAVQVSVKGQKLEQITPTC